MQKLDQNLCRDKMSNGKVLIFTNSAPYHIRQTKLMDLMLWFVLNSGAWIVWKDEDFIAYQELKKKISQFIIWAKRSGSGVLTVFTVMGWKYKAGLGLIGTAVFIWVTSAEITQVSWSIHIHVLLCFLFPYLFLLVLWFCWFPGNGWKRK